MDERLVTDVRRFPGEVVPGVRKAAQDYYADLEARKGHAQSLAAPEQMIH
jgi:hypothetical protein